MPKLTVSPLKRHQISWKDCKRCELHCGRRKVALIRGRVPAKALFIGEAPGTSEDTLGVPFIGPAGKLLDKIIDSSVLSPRDCAFTNLIGCISKDEDGKIVNPPEDAIKSCSKRIVDLIKICKPKMIIWVGKIAKKHGTKILDQCGIELPQTEIIHPAILFRMHITQQGLSFQKCVIAVDDLLEEI